MRRIQLSARGGGACETEPWLVSLALRDGGESSLAIATGKETTAATD